MSKLSIVIADDHIVVREGTRRMLEADSEFEVLGEAPNGNEAINLTNLKQPDILLLDISMPDINGIEVLRRVKQNNPNQKVVIFTAHSDLQYVKAAIKSNADGYLTKNIDCNQLISSLKKIYEGNKIVSQEISSQLASQFWNDVKSPADLTSREYEIMLLVARGKSNHEVSDELCIAVRTVETHVANILKKLKFTNRTQISSYAYENGLI